MKIFNYKSYIHVKISILLYLASLFFPAIYYLDLDRQIGYYHSLALLLLGWVSIVIGYDCSWLANILYLIALHTSKSVNLSSLSALLGLFTIFLSLLFLLQEKIIDPYEFGLVPITEYGWGYYLWVASFCVFCAGQTWLSICRSKTNC